MVDELGEDFIWEETTNPSRQKKAIEEQLAGLRLTSIPGFDRGDMTRVGRVSAAIGTWLKDLLN